MPDFGHWLLYTSFCKEDKSMKYDKFWTALSRVLAVVTVALVVVLMLAPCASAAAKYKVLYRFTGGSDGGQPETGVIFDTSDNLYGTTYVGGDYGSGTVFKLAPNGDGTWTESVLHSFGGSGDGASPIAPLVFDSNGNLYGTTSGGGTYGQGIVFQLTPNSDDTWTENVLYNFAGGRDGASPAAGLILDTAGNLYGTTRNGGRCAGPGCGTVFELTPTSDTTWTETVLHRFAGGKDGAVPDHASLVFDAAGNLYGTTALNSPNCCAWAGTVFELMPKSDGSWKEKVLLRFNDKNGSRPEGTLIFDSTGNLYGTTSKGGPHSCPYDSCGQVFKLTPTPGGKWKQHTIHGFRDAKDGAGPDGGVIFDASGNLYDAAAAGGGGPCNWYGSGCGTVFKLIPEAGGKWREQVLHQFWGGNVGSTPLGNVVFDAAGNIYGTTWDAAIGGSGLVYEITP
jgi:uncharacterized repeat protein (TIGR03803 family)